VTYGQQQHSNLELLVRSKSDGKRLVEGRATLLEEHWEHYSDESGRPDISTPGEIQISWKIGDYHSHESQPSSPEGCPTKILQPIPYALRDQGNNELDRLEKEGVLEKTR
jgi:hypothetical protein